MIGSPARLLCAFTACLLAGCATLWCGEKSQASQADRIVVIKAEHSLTLLQGGKILKSYKVALGGHPIGAKTHQGDGRTPEGVYTIDSRNAHSQFHLSLHISYPMLPTGRGPENSG